MEDEPRQPIDALIVGGGLGGCLLAWTMEQLGWDYRLVHKTLPGSAWPVSPAVFSPFAAHTLKPVPHYERYRKAAVTTYREIEKATSELVFWDTPILYQFTNPRQREAFAENASTPDGERIEALLEPGKTEGGVHLPDGGALIKDGGSISVPRLVEAFHRRLKASERLVDDVFEYEYLECYEDGVIYDEYEPSVIVFAEGGGVRANPWFGAEIIDPHRGEVVDIGSEKDCGDLIVIGERWLAPVADGRYFCGGVQFPQGLESEPTESARKDLINAAEHILDATCNAFGQRAGIIPHGADRNPVVGPHPDLPYLQVFNGFGDNGALLMPFWARQLVKSLAGQSELPEAVRPSRFNFED